MKKVEWKTLNVTLKTGQTLAEKEISLNQGDRIVSAASFSGNKDKVVNLELMENGNTVSAAMDLDFWKKSNAGKYLDGFKPIEYKGGSTVKAVLFTDTALGADLPVQVVFGIIKDDTTC
ncbi:hypothetical protein RM549_06195 [Salegentibacter sp. F188]|uniref:Uncharacterized protein n=1 Tax=Autumnicola patrickiae TaxID=3075591 RepID=A0ABU3E0F4_9FLAO|nr:hypothetical protein [Salegentibacter sp. F188]MDT0689368.1 hypothetical protein [Salegentibacter sp. F188]